MSIPKLMRVIGRIDIWLILRVLMPILHWIDYRWHINQYRVAGYVMSLSLTLLVLGDLLHAINSTRVPGAFYLLSGGSLVYLYSSYLIQFDRASSDYERRPDAIPRDAVSYILMPSLARLLMLIVAALVMAASVMGSRWPIDAPWLPMAISCWYIMACPPPRRDRKKKKERAGWGALFPKLAASNG